MVCYPARACAARGKVIVLVHSDCAVHIGCGQEHGRWRLFFFFRSLPMQIWRPAPMHMRIELLTFWTTFLDPENPCTYWVWPGGGAFFFRSLPMPSTVHAGSQPGAHSLCPSPLVVCVTPAAVIIRPQGKVMLLLANSTSGAWPNLS